MVSPPAVAVLLKRVDLRPVIDPLSGAITADEHGGMSAADECALELALRQAERAATGVLAVSAGGLAAEQVLRQAVEAGAVRAVRVELPAEAPSAAVASALAAEVRGCSWVWCGAYSLDRASGSVPAFVAGHLGAAQALGVAAVAADGDALVVERRLDGGRREVVRVDAPAVISVEAGVAPLRRAALASAIAADRAVIERHRAPVPDLLVSRRRAYRPRARVLPGPGPALAAWERAAALAGVHTQRSAPRVVRAGSEEAVDELLAFLRGRAYWDGDGAPA